MKDGKVESAAQQIFNGKLPREELVAPLRVRVAGSTVERLDLLEAFFRGKGYRYVSRSFILRLAIDRLLREVMDEHPEIEEDTIQH